MAFDFNSGTDVPVQDNNTPAAGSPTGGGFDFNSGSDVAGQTPVTQTPPADTGAPTSFGQVADNVVGGINKGIDVAQNSIFSPLNWLGKVGGLAVGAAGGLIGGAVGAVGTPIANAIKGKPVLQNLGQNIAGTAKATAGFGYNTGDQGVKSAPFMGLGKIPGGVIGATQLYQGGKDIISGKYEDSVLPIITGLASFYGASQGKGLLVNKSMVNDVNVVQKTNNASKFMGIDPANLTKKQVINARTSFQTEPPTGLFGKSGVVTPTRNIQIAKDYLPNFDSSNPETLINNFKGTIDIAGQARNGLLDAHPLTVPPNILKNLISQKISNVAQKVIDESANPVGTTNIMNRSIDNFIKDVGENPTLRNISDAQIKFNGKIDYSSGKLSPTAQTQIAIRNGIRDVIQDKLDTLPGQVGTQYKTLIKALSDQETAVRSIAQHGINTLGKNKATILVNNALESIMGPVGKVAKKVFFGK